MMHRYDTTNDDVIQCSVSGCEYVRYGKKETCYKHYMKSFNQTYYKINKDKIKTQTKEWYYTHHEDQKSKKRTRQKGNPYYVEKARIYWQKNKDALGPKNMKYYYNNSEEINKKSYQRKRVRYYSDVEFRLKEVLSARMRQALLHNRKSASPELRVHLERQFKDGMSWDNHAITGWHIDHIRPCDSFDLTDPEQQKKCFHYSNLQPLWFVDNIRKGVTG